MAKKRKKKKKGFSLSGSKPKMIEKEILAKIERLEIPSVHLSKKEIKPIKRFCSCGRRVSRGHHKYCEKCWEMHRAKIKSKKIGVKENA
jgi:hypothetical protein